MAFSEKEYKALFNLFEGNENLIADVSFKDVSSLSNFLLGKLNGTEEGLKDLEDITKKWIEILRTSDISNQSKSIIQQSIILAYTRISLRMSGN